MGNAVNSTVCPWQIAVEDAEIVTDGVNATELITIVTLSCDKTVCGSAQLSDDVIATLITSPSANDEL